MADEKGTDSSSPWRMHLLVSSMSAHGHAIKVGPSVVAILRAAGWKVSVSVTTAEDTPSKIAEASLAPFVAALGGDGYLSQVAQGVKGTGAVFVPLPGGRGNDLCRALNVSADPVERARELSALLEHRTDDEIHEVVEQHTRDIDAMWLHEEGKAPRIALGILSLGFDASVNQIANDSWFRSGPIAYGYGALAGFASYKERPIRALVDGKERDLSGWIASVSNSGMFGGGIHFVPSSGLEDGCMELVHVGSASRSVVLRALLEILKSRNAEHPLIQVSQVRSISFVEPAGMDAWADGDPVATVPFSVSMERGAIRTLA